MIEWWGWVVLWSALVIVLLAVLVIAAWRLFRKGMTVLDELDSLVSQLDRLEAVVDEAPAPQRLAVLEPYAEVAARRTAAREAAANRKALRRQRRFARGKLITTAEPVKRT